MAPKEINANPVADFITTIGLFLGTQHGIVMDKNAVGGKFQWSKIWAVPLAISLAGAIVLPCCSKVPNPAEFQQDKRSDVSNGRCCESSLTPIRFRCEKLCYPRFRGHVEKRGKITTCPRQAWAWHPLDPPDGCFCNSN